MAEDTGVVEIVTIKLNQGVSVEEFALVDKAVEDEHVSKQPGFISRTTAQRDGKWLVIVHWESAKAAQDSMDTFAKAPAASKFISMIDASSMTMTRYNLVR